MKVVIAGGGTAGHVNPAVSLALALDGADVTFVGTSKGVESTIVPEAGFPMEEIEVTGFDRSKPLSLISTGMTALRAVRSSRALLKRLRPDVVVGMGGYVSLPVTWAAGSAGASVVLHEQNIVLGLAHKVTKRRATRIAVSFEETLEQVGRKGVFTGNPVARDLIDMNSDEARPKAYESFELRPDRSTLLVFGGSQGAKRINESAAGLALLWRDREDVQVLHITGRAAFEAIRERVGDDRGRRLVYRVVPYVADMGLAYAAADLALCRGGATTVAELGVTGVPSVIVPYPYHRDKQQERHGRVLEKAGAARVLTDEEATTDRVAEIAGGLLGDRDSLARMREATSKWGRPDAADRLAEVVRGAVP